MFTAHGDAMALATFGRAAPEPAPPATSTSRSALAVRLAAIDLAHDLASDIGSRRWFRGAATFIALAATAISFWPGFAPVSASPVAMGGTDGEEEMRSQMIAPLAFGADSGRHMAAGQGVRALATAPDRPEIALVATLTPGDGFGAMLRRAGVGSADASRALALVSSAVDPAALAPGTQVDITLGARPSPDAARPLESLRLRARFDLALAVERSQGGVLSLTRKPIAVDETPLRIRGLAGPGLYRSARAAGAPASVVQAYLEQLGRHVDLEEGLLPTDSFDIIVQHRRAATGESQPGQLLYAGIDRGGRPRVQLMRWGEEFYEASGVGEEASGLVAPVPGRLTSHFGQRRHPILGYVRMHAGLDFAASYGTPIVAVTDGRVSGAGHMGGCGAAVSIDHGGGLQTRYCHMSRIAAGAGQVVARGQVIGYVGSSGLSTGPHLHYEMRRNGEPVDPAQVTFISRAQLAGTDLRRFREALEVLREVRSGAALRALAAEGGHQSGLREIDRLGRARAPL